MADGRGRPRSFDIEHVLEKSLDLFWQGGYLGTSYSDICKATSLGKPSLYAALGNKESTFLAVLNLYVSRSVQPGIELLEREANVKDAVHKLLLATVDGLTAKATPPGCFIATNISCSATPLVPQTVTEALQTAAAKTRLAIAARLERGLDDGQLPPRADVGALTCFFDTLIAGLSSLAKKGTPRPDLIKAVEIAMLTWPSR